MSSVHKSQKSAVFAALGLILMARVPESQAFSPEGDALIAVLQDRIAAGLGGEEAMQEAYGALAEDPDAGCATWGEDGLPGMEEDRDLAAALAAVCPEMDTPAPAEGRGLAPRADARGVQRVRSDAGAADPAWSTRASAQGFSLRADGVGPEWRRRWVRWAGRGGFMQAGHLGHSLEATRIAAVAGVSTLAQGIGSGMDGPLASSYPGLDGFSLGRRAGGWALQGAAAWDRLADARGPGNPYVTLRRDAGFAAAGAAHGSAAEGLEARAQALVLRLETGNGPGSLLAVAGLRLARGDGPLAWSAAGAASRASSGRAGAYADLAMGWKDADTGNAIPEWDPDPSPSLPSSRWRLRARQASAGWANPLQSPRGNLRDTVGGWAVAERGEGAAAGATGFPLGSSGAYAASLRAAAGAGWAGADAAGPRARYGHGDVAVVQGYGPFTATTGAGLGWRRKGSGAPSAGGWNQSLAWREGPWSARLSVADRGEDYAGLRPAPLSLFLARRLAGTGARAAWSLEWSSGDARRPWREQRLDGVRTWMGSGGWRLEQRLRVPWTPAGIAGGLAYQLTLAAEL